MQIYASSHISPLQAGSNIRSKDEQSNNNSPSDSNQANKQAAESEKQYNEQRHLQQLKSIDRAVRAHELAHQSVGGRYVTSGARFQYERGSDGRNYAIAGEVSIDTSEIPGNPQATLAKAKVILRAALAPVDPSAQDRQVAAIATSMIQQALASVAQDSTPVEGFRIGGELDTFA
jgi:hypothetical protein